MNKPLHPLLLGATATAAIAALTVTGLSAMAQPPAPAADAGTESDWTSLRGDITRRGASSETIKTPLSLLWRYSAGALRGNQSAPVVSGKTVYFSALGSGEGGVLYALDTDTGARKWTYPTDQAGLPNKGQFLTAPLVADGRLYVGASDGTMYVLDAQTGKQVFPLRTSRPINSAPTIDGGVLYFGSNDGNLYAVDPATGEPHWKQYYQTGSSVNSAPIIANGQIYVTTADNNIHALVESTGKFRWKLRIPERMMSNAPIFADNVLYVPASQRLYALQGTSGLARWSRDLPSDILAPPVADGGIVYAICRATQGNGSLLYAFRSANGKEAWDQAAALPLAPSAAPTIAGNVIFIPTNRNVLMAVSTEDGHVLWQHYMEPSSNKPPTQRQGFGGFTGDNSATSSVATRTTVSLVAPPAIAHGTVYTLADDGSLSAFRSDAPDTTGPQLTYQYPQPGQAISGAPPVTVAANFVDMGTGIDPKSLVLKLDDKEVPATFDANRNLIIFATKSTGKQIDPPLADGRHSVSVTASDWRGNSTDQAWSFVVNNALQPVRGEAPSAPKAPTTPRATNNTPQNPRNQPGNVRPGRGTRGGRGGRGAGNNGR